MKRKLFSLLAAVLVFSAAVLGWNQPARAALCGKCRDLMFVDSQGKCSDCGGPTASGALQLCPKCSARRHQCEHCLAATTEKDEADAQSKPADAPYRNQPTAASSRVIPRTNRPWPGPRRPIAPILPGPTKCRGRQPDGSGNQPAAAGQRQTDKPMPLESLPESRPPAELPPDPVPPADPSRSIPPRPARTRRENGVTRCRLPVPAPAAKDAGAG